MICHNTRIICALTRIWAAEGLACTVIGVIVVAVKPMANIPIVAIITMLNENLWSVLIVLFIVIHMIREGSIYMIIINE
jgi:hypothetical protein